MIFILLLIAGSVQAAEPQNQSRCSAEMMSVDQIRTASDFILYFRLGDRRLAPEVRQTLTERLEQAVGRGQAGFENFIQLYNPTPLQQMTYEKYVVKGAVYDLGFYARYLKHLRGPDDVIALYRFETLNPSEDYKQDLAELFSREEVLNHIELQNLKASHYSYLIEEFKYDEKVRKELLLRAQRSDRQRRELSFIKRILHRVMH